MCAIAPFQIAGPRNNSDLSAGPFLQMSKKNRTEQKRREETGKATTDAEPLKDQQKKIAPFPVTSTRVIQEGCSKNHNPIPLLHITRVQGMSSGFLPKSQVNLLFRFLFRITVLAKLNRR